MLIKDILAKKKPSISLEFFPPKEKKEQEKLLQAAVDLLFLKPSHISITYGAGGTSRDRTLDMACRLAEQTGLPVVSHLTCIGSSRDEIHSLLKTFDKNNINNILALRGDPPKGEPWTRTKNGFTYAAELVAFIKQKFPHMGIGVAGFPEGHPDTPNRLLEIDHLKAKVDAGADYIVTQLFFDNNDFFDFCERCRLAGVKVPVLAGILPISSKEGMVRMAELAAGSRIPAPLLKAVYNAPDNERVKKIGVKWSAAQVRNLLDNGVDGIHFYTLNSAALIRDIYKELNISDASRLS